MQETSPISFETEGSSPCSLVAFLSQMNLFHTFQSYYCNIYLHIIHPSTAKYSQWSLSFRISCPKLRKQFFSLLSYAPHYLPISCSLVLLFQQHIVNVTIVKLLIMQLIVHKNIKPLNSPVIIFQELAHPICFQNPRASTCGSASFVSPSFHDGASPRITLLNR